MEFPYCQWKFHKIMNLSNLKIELESADKIALGLQVKKRRENADLSQTELADKVDCHQSTIFAIESGKKTYSARKLVDVAEYFKDDFGLQSLKEVIHTPEGIKKRFAELSMKFSTLQPSRRHKPEVLLEHLERELDKQHIQIEIENQLEKKASKDKLSKD